MRGFVDEALRMSRVCLQENAVAGFILGLSKSVVDAVGGVEPDARVMMLIVVPIKEGVAEDAGVLDRTELVREFGPVLHGLELGFGERVVVRDMGTGVGLGHSEITKELGDKFGFHGRAAIGVKRELAWENALLSAGF